MATSFTTRFNQLRTWGLKGALNYLKRIHEKKRIERYFTLNAQKHPCTPTAGLTLIADMTGTGSLSKVMRDLATRLRDAKIPYQTFDLHEGKPAIPESDYQDIITPAAEFKIMRYTNVIEICTRVLPTDLPLKRSVVYFWEFDTGLVEYDRSLPFDNEVVGMSDFNCDVFRKSLPPSVSVKKILYPFVFDVKDIASPEEIRGKYGLSQDDFIVFFNFDFGTSYKRKNPEDALRAFAMAFADEPRARFVFKAKNAKHHPDDVSALHALARQLNVNNRVLLVTDYLSTCELYGLTNACDVYLSLHRGEGFGLGIAEAMSLGKPAIVTDYSSTTEFCNPRNSISIPYTMIDVQPGDIDNPCYHAVKRWAQPNVPAAAKALRELFDNPARRIKLGFAAKTFIEDYFSTENFKKSILKFLNDQ